MHESMRGRPGRSRYKRKVRSVIPFRTFERLVEKAETLAEKSLIVLLYYTGLRPAEIVGDGDRKWKVLTEKGRMLSKEGNLPKDWIKRPEEEGLWTWRHRGKSLVGILKEDMIVEGDILRIYSHPLKHGKRGDRKEEEYIELDLNYPYLNLVVEQLNQTKEGERVWKFSTWQVWHMISTLSGGKLYPHAFRFSRATQLAHTPKISIGHMQHWFGWARASTADSYIRPVRTSEIVREAIRRELSERAKERDLNPPFKRGHFHMDIQK